MRKGLRRKSMKLRGIPAMLSMIDNNTHTFAFN